MAIFSHITPSTQNTAALAQPAAQPRPQGPEADADQVKRFGLRPGAITLPSLGKRGTAPLQPGAAHATPVVGGAPPAGRPPPGGVHANPDPSRLSQFSMRLNELLNKVFVASSASSMTTTLHTGTSPFSGASIHVPRFQSITYGTSHLPNRLRLIELTRLVIEELYSAAEVDPYLLRAVSRTVLKTLSQFVTRIESQLVSSVTDPAAHQVPTSVKGQQGIPAAMEFNLAIMSMEWIVEESLERCLDGLPPLALLYSPSLLSPTAAEGTAQPRMPSFVFEILSPLREQMEASIIHVVQPILLNVKASLVTCLLRANTQPFTPRGLGESVSCTDSTDNASKVPWYKELEERLDAAYRLLMLRVADRCGQDGQAWFISVATYAIWKGLVILTARSVYAPAASVESDFSHALGRTTSTVPTSQVLSSLLSGDGNARRVPTPTQLAHALRSVSLTGGHRLRRAQAESNTAAHTPREASFEDLSLPRGASGAPGRTGDCYVVSPLLVAEQLHDLQVFERLMRQFCTPILPLPSARRSRTPGPHVRGNSMGGEQEADDSAPPGSPVASPEDLAELHALQEDQHDEEDLAKAALQEAFSTLMSTIIVLRTLLQDPEALQHLSLMSSSSSESLPSPLPQASLQAFQMIPSLLLIQIAYCRIPPGWLEHQQRVDDAGLQVHDELLPTPARLFGYTWEEYEAALPGFSAGELAARSLAQSYAPVLSRLYRSLDTVGAEADHELLASTVFMHPSSDASDDSDSEVPPAMTVSMPGLEPRPREGAPGLLSLSRPAKTPVTMARGAATADDSVLASSGHRHPRSQVMANAPRLWRRQHPPTHKFALPPRVSRAHATSSFGRSRSRGPGRDDSPSRYSFRLSSNTLEQMQRNALQVYEGVLRRIVEQNADM